MIMAQNIQFSISNFCNLIDWSVGSSFSKLQTTKYQVYPLGKYLKRVKEKIQIRDDVQYKQITVRLYGQGVSQRCVRMGKDIGTKTQFVAHAGQLIISRIDARNGAFGIVPDSLEGAIVTNDFWLFDVIGASTEFMMLLLSSTPFQTQWQALSTGTTNRQRVSESDFLNFKAPIPSLDEQNSLMSIYNRLSETKYQKQTEIIVQQKSIERFLLKALGISRKSNNSKNSFISFATFAAIHYWGVDKILHGVQQFYNFDSPLFCLCEKRDWIVDVFRGKSPIYQKNSDHIILNQKCNRWNFIDEQFAKSVDSKWYASLDQNVFLKENDIVINSTGEGTLGRASLVTSKHVGYLVDSHMLVLRLNKCFLSPEFIVRQINSEFGQKQVDLLKGAQATKQTELGVDNLLKMSFVIPINKHGYPDLDIQKNVVNEIKKIETHINELSSEVDLLDKECIAQFEKAIFG